LKNWIQTGAFLLAEPVEKLPTGTSLKGLIGE